MSALDLAAVIVAVVCLAAVAVLTVAVGSLVRTMRELRDVAAELRSSALPVVDDLRTTVTRADAELQRVDGVIGRAERVAVTVDHASRLAHRAFAPPLIKGLSLLSGAGHAGRRLRERRRARRQMGVSAFGRLEGGSGDVGVGSGVSHRPDDRFGRLEGGSGAGADAAGGVSGEFAAVGGLAAVGGSDAVAGVGESGAAGARGRHRRPLAPHSVAGVGESGTAGTRGRPMLRRRRR